MKKISVMLAALAVVLAAALTGCSSTNALTSTVASETSGSWYKYSKGSISVGDTGSSNSLSFAEAYFKYSTSTGLTVILAQNAATTTYAKPLYAKHTYTTAEFNSVKWTALLASGKIAKTSTPACVSNPSLYIDASSASGILSGTINWKSLLANQIVAWLGQ